MKSDLLRPVPHPTGDLKLGPPAGSPSSEQHNSCSVLSRKGASLHFSEGLSDSLAHRRRVVKFLIRCTNEPGVIATPKLPIIIHHVYFENP